MPTTGPVGSSVAERFVQGAGVEVSDRVGHRTRRDDAKGPTRARTRDVPMNLGHTHMVVCVRPTLGPGPHVQLRPRVPGKTPPPPLPQLVVSPTPTVVPVHPTPLPVVLTGRVDTQGTAPGAPPRWVVFVAGLFGVLTSRRQPRR